MEITMKTFKEHLRIIIKNNNFFFLIFIVFFSCDAMPKRQAIAYQEMASFSKILSKKMNIKIMSMGGSFLDEEIKYFSMDFLVNEEIELDKARELYLYILNEFSNKINSNKEICRYLKKQNCLLENIDFNITFHDKKDNYSLPPYIYHIHKTKNKIIFFDTYDKEKDWYNTISREPVDKALENLRQSNKKLYQEFITTFNFTPSLE